MSDITQWLAERGLSKYAPRFLTEEIDLEALAFLDDDDLKSLGLPLGPRRKILKAIAEAAVSAMPAAGPPPTKDAVDDVTAETLHVDRARPAVLAGEAELGERKRVTVLFADLRGSTSLIAGLDAEEAVERLRPAVEAMVTAVQRG